MINEAWEEVVNRFWETLKGDPAVLELEAQMQHRMLWLKQVLDYIYDEAMRRYGQSEAKDWVKIHALEQEVFDELMSSVREKK